MQVLELILLFAMIGIGAFILVNGLMTAWLLGRMILIFSENFVNNKKNIDDKSFRFILIPQYQHFFGWNEAREGSFMQGFYTLYR